MKTQKTNRGFRFKEFRDHYGALCYLQDSSLATERALWLGVRDADPKILAHDAARIGVPTEATSGWIPYPKIPSEVLLTTQMHLNRDQVQTLIDELQSWLKKGHL